MIRTTISKIKRVWAITFSPRLLRGDLLYPPGKFQILTPTAQTPSLIRTKSTDSLYEEHQKRAKYDIDNVRHEQDGFDDYLSHDILAKGTKHGAPRLYKTQSACRCDECNKIIAEIFGEEVVPSQRDNDLKTKVLANIAQVNMTDNSGSDKIVTDSRIHGGLFNDLKKKDDVKEFSEKKKQNVDNDPIIMTKDNYRSVLCHEVILMNERGKSPELDLDTHRMYNNLYDVDPEEYQLGSGYTNKNILSEKELKDQKVDEYWKDVYETAVGENSVYCEPTLSIDSDTLNTYKALKARELTLKDTSGDSCTGMRQMKFSPKEVEKMYEKPRQAENKSDSMDDIFDQDIFNDDIFKNDINDAKEEDRKMLLIKTNTTKQDDEKLTQKLEHIKETPLVEAEKSKIEGVQVTPKVLGYVEKETKLNSLDEVAKRCLTSPNNQIDEILLKEMEKLGIPLTVQRSTYGLKMDDIQADTSSKSKAIDQQIENEVDNKALDSNSGALNKPNNLIELKKDETNTLKLDLDINRTKVTEDIKKIPQPDLEPSHESDVYNENHENKSGWLYWRSNNNWQSWPKSSGTSEQENNHRFSDSLWQKHQLDPKHVLTCNETCSISPKPLTSTNDKNRIDGTEIMLEHQISLKDENIKQNPLLEDGESDASTRRTENCSKTNLVVTKKSEAIEAYNFTNSAVMCNSAMKELSKERNYLDSVIKSSLELPRSENSLGYKEDPKFTVSHIKDSSRTEPSAIESTNEQLQLTSEQLQAASVQLQATCEYLQTTSEQLQATTEQLQATSDHLLDSSDKLHAASGNLYTTSEKLQYSSEKLRDTSEQLGFDMYMLLNKLTTYPAQTSQGQKWDANEEAEQADAMYLDYNKHVSSTPKIITSSTTSTETNYKPITPCVTPATASIIEKSFKNLYGMKGPIIEKQQVDIKDVQITTSGNEYKYEQETPKAFDSKIDGWAHQASAINPSVPMTEDLPSVKPLPEVTDRVKLSELMRLVRERNRLVDCHEAVVLSKSRKTIPPLARPMQTPSNEFKMPSYPTLKPIPRICVPKRRPDNPKSVKCCGCDVDKLGLDQSGPLAAHNESDGLAASYNSETINFTFVEEDMRTDLTEEFILQLQYLGNELESSFKRTKAEILEAAALAKTSHLAKIFRSKDYEPWSPIPSWPYPKKQVRQKLQCPKDGCKIPPPQCVEDRPCGLKPCESFPTFPRRTFSLLDCYPVSLGDHQVIDVGKF